MAKLVTVFAGNIGITNRFSIAEEDLWTCIIAAFACATGYCRRICSGRIHLSRSMPRAFSRVCAMLAGRRGGVFAFISHVSDRVRST
jgi:hypothetical protein